MAGNEVIARHTHVSASLADCRGRLKGFIVNHSTGVTEEILIYDNASAASGNVLLEIDETTQGTITYEIPGDGIIFADGLYVSLPANTTITLFMQLGGR